MKEDSLLKAASTDGKVIHFWSHPTCFEQFLLYPFFGERSLLLGTGGPLGETFVSSAWGQTPVWISSTVLATSRASVCPNVSNNNCSSRSHNMTWCGHSIKITGRNHLHLKDTSSKVWFRYCPLVIQEWQHITQNRQFRLNHAANS